MPQNVASHQGLHCLPLIQQYLDSTVGSKLCLFKFYIKYSKELKCLNTYGKDGINSVCHSDAALKAKINVVCTCITVGLNLIFFYMLQILCILASSYNLWVLIRIAFMRQFQYVAQGLIC